MSQIVLRYSRIAYVLMVLSFNSELKQVVDLGQVGHGVSSHQLDGRPKCTDNLAEQSGDDQLGRHGW